MPAVRKMLGSATSPYIVSLMRAIETQSVHTIASWATAYACEQLLPIFEAAFAQDARPRQALDAAQAYLRGECKLADAKKSIRTAQTAAQEAAAIPAAQAAARAVFAAASAIHTPTFGLSLAFYGTAALAYARVGLHESAETYDRIAVEECARMEEALRAVSVEDEPNPAKIDWGC